jgi:hypothetical protein
VDSSTELSRGTDDCACKEGVVCAAAGGVVCEGTAGDDSVDGLGSFGCEVLMEEERRGRKTLSCFSCSMRLKATARSKMDSSNGTEDDNTNRLCLTSKCAS